MPARRRPSLVEPAAYESYGEGPRVVVLLHGLLLSQRMHEPLARALAERGNRVITLDLLGHGELRPPARHVALLDDRRSASR